MQNDPFEISFPLGEPLDESLMENADDEFERTPINVPYPDERIGYAPSPPAPLAPPPQRRSGRRQYGPVPPDRSRPISHRLGLEDVETQVVLPLESVSGQADGALTRGQRRRRLVSSGVSLLSLPLLLVLLLAVILIGIRANDYQSGSGVAIGSEFRPTPVSPLAQVPTAQPTKTLQTPTAQPTKVPAPPGQKTPPPGPSPTAPPQQSHGGPIPTATPAKGPGKGPAPSPTVVPTLVPTSAPTPLGGGTPTPTPRGPLPTATATDVPPTPTLPPQPTATTVSASAGSLTFTDQSQAVSSPSSLTGCPSGCSFATTALSGSTSESIAWNASGHVQTQLSGALTIVLVPTAIIGGQTFYVQTLSGHGWTCSVYQTVVADVPLISNCSFGVPSPSYLSPNTISGQELVNDDADTLGYQSSAFTGNSVPQVTQGDCTNALAYVVNQGNAWINNTWNQEVSGAVVARYMSTGMSNQQCPVGAAVPNDIFSASVVASFWNGLIYDASGPINEAASLLQSDLPSGWSYAYTSAACSPNLNGISGNTITVACQDSGLAVYTWTAGTEAGLAQAVAGQTIASAESTCNGYAHVGGNCVATSNAGNVMPPPADWQGISVTPQNPANPFGTADVGSLPVDSAWDIVPPGLSFVLLCLGCFGVLWRRRKVVE